MKRIFQIGEIAQFFHLPASTLRYWEECGVITPQKNQDNRYRVYTVSDLMTISDVIFYKSLGIPLKRVRGMKENTPAGQKEIFEQKLLDLQEEQRQLMRRMEKLYNHINAVETIEILKQEVYQETDIDTECIVSFDLIEQDKLLQYVEDPYLYSRVQHSSAPHQEQRGLTVPSDFEGRVDDLQVIWRKKGNQYIAFLMREEVSENFPNDLQKHLAHIQKNHKTGDIISRFLLCAQEDGKTFDFYKTFVEILPEE